MARSFAPSQGPDITVKVGITTSTSLFVSYGRAHIDRVRPVVDLRSTVGVNFFDVERIDPSFLLFPKRFSWQRQVGAPSRV